jgi:hypothetical protein
VLTNRTDHIERMAQGLSGVEHVLILKGGMGKKQRQAAAEKLAYNRPQVAIVLPEISACTELRPGIERINVKRNLANVLDV